MPWDLSRSLAAGHIPLLLDVREGGEFQILKIPGSINVPRGVLEQSCEWNFDETVPELAKSREQAIVVICRSGNRSVLAADVMMRMGFSNVVSLKTGVKGWNDYDQPLTDDNGNVVDADTAENILSPHLKQEQRSPA
jgi:rhodanese-related sulfurtransferase